MAESLDRLRDLAPGWDGYSAPRIAEQALRTAAGIQYTPMSHGGLMIELHTLALSVEIEVEADGRIAGVSVEPVNR